MDRSDVAHIEDDELHQQRLRPPEPTFQPPALHAHGDHLRVQVQVAYHLLVLVLRLHALALLLIAREPLAVHRRLQRRRVRAQLLPLEQARVLRLVLLEAHPALLRRRTRLLHQIHQTVHVRQFQWREDVVVNYQLAVRLVRAQRVAVVPQDVLDVRRRVWVFEVIIVDHHIVEVVVVVAEGVGGAFCARRSIRIVVEEDLLLLDDIRRRNVRG